MLGPSDDVAVAVDMARVRASDFYNRFNTQLREMAGKLVPAAILSECGNPIEVVTKATIGVDADSNAMGAVVHGYTAAAVDKCLATLGSNGFTVERQGSQALVSEGANTDKLGLIVWPDGTLFLYGEPQMTHAKLTAAQTRGGLSPALARDLAAVDTARALRIAVLGEAALGGADGPKSARGWLDVQANLSAEGVMVMPSADAAQRLVDQSAGVLGMARAMTNKLEVTAKDAEVHGQLEVTPEQLRTLGGLAGMAQ